MGADDFLNGRAAANFANQGEVDDWENYSNKLKNRLKQTELDFVKAESGRIGFAHLFKTVVEELRRVDPNNPLLLKENQLKIVGAKIAEKVNEMGYIYDARSDRVIGKR